MLRGESEIDKLCGDEFSEAWLARKFIESGIAFPANVNGDNAQAFNAFAAEGWYGKIHTPIGLKSGRKTLDYIACKLAQGLGHAQNLSTLEI